MTSDSTHIGVETSRPARLSTGGYIRLLWRRLMRRLARLGIYYRFTTITGRILVVNIVSLLFLVGGMLYLSDFRDRLIAARAESLKIEAEIIAKALSLDRGSRSSDNAEDVILGPPAENVYKISLEKSADLLRTLVKPANTHGYIYSADGTWLMDSNRIYKSGKITQYQNPTERRDEVGWQYRLWLSAEHILRWENLPLQENISMQNGKSLPEVKAALEEGSATGIVRENELGETIINYAVPIERGGTVLGALLLTTDDGAIDALIAEERRSALNIFLLILGMTGLASFALAGTIAGPMHRLAQAAERVRSNVKARADIPDFSHRSDEIGYLARAFREMTAALYARLDAIERFAADVAHELKNPLTSLQSAVDTLPLVKKEADQERLIEVIRHDVRRLNRLITDISEASRLDAELQRQIRRPVNVASLLDMLCCAHNDIPRERCVKIELHIAGTDRAVALGPKSPFLVYGDEGRLSQVIVNLIENAISFSPEHGKIWITCRLVRSMGEIEISVDDEGPGIPSENLEKIFERFYTDRPEQEEFGNNSGLGLNISRQIIDAHKGRIWAENRKAAADGGTRSGGGSDGCLGASFKIRLPFMRRDG